MDLKPYKIQDLMSRIMNSASDLDSLIMQHAEDSELAKNGWLMME